MELTEVVSPTVALPVIGVLVCAFLVFAFGFKSPAQPPSFDFDDDGKRKKYKKAKKSQSNGHAVTVPDPEVSVSNSAKQQSSPRQTGKQVAKQQSPSNKTKQQEVKAESAKKVKKPVAKEGVKPPVEVVEEEGWTTQVSRKKLRNKKEEKMTEMWGEEEMEVVPVPAPVPPSPPQEQRVKKKKEKKSKKAKGEGEGDEVIAAQPTVEESKPEEVQAEVQVEVEEKVAPVVAAAVEAVDVSPTSQAAEESQSKKKLKNKKEKKKSPPPPEMAVPEVSSVEQEIEHAMCEVVVPSGAAAGDEGVQEKMEGEWVAPKAKSPKRKQKNKDKSKENIVEEKSSPVELVSQSVKSDDLRVPSIDSVPVTDTTTASPKKSSTVTDVTPDSTPSEEATDSPASKDITAPLFDEMGESWLEAKPKSKKKKPRREN